MRRKSAYYGTFTRFTFSDDPTLLTLLRFGNRQFRKDLQPLMGFRDIGRILGISEVTARRHLSSLSSRVDILNLPSSGCQLKLSKEHVGFLVSPSTLREWSHLNLRDRCAYLHRAFPEIRISQSTLSRVYRKHGI